MQKRTLANLSKLPDDAVEGLKVLLKGGVAIESLSDAFKVIRSRRHGHVATVYGTINNLKFQTLLREDKSKKKDY